MCRRNKLINQRSEVRGRKSEVGGQRAENRVRWMGVLLLCVSILVSSQVFAQNKGKITLLVGASNSYKVSEAISDIVKIPEAAGSYDFYFYTNKDLEEGKIDAKIIAQSRILVVDDMHRKLADYSLKNADFEKTKVYGLCSAAKEPEKIISDPGVKQYYNPATSKNIRNLLLFLLNRDCGLDINYGEPQNIPEMGIFHPKSDRIFTGFEEYLSWYKEKGFYKKTLQMTSYIRNNL